MNLKPMTDFLASLSHDPALKSAFTARMAGLSADEDAEVHVIAFAREAGHALSADDTASFATLLDRHARGELSDDQLEEVSGGIFGALAGGILVGLAPLIDDPKGMTNALNGFGYFDPRSPRFWTGLPI